MNKKAVRPIEIIMILVIVSVVAFILLFAFRKYFGKEVGIVEEKITGLGDADEDGVANMFDKCPNEDKAKKDLPRDADGCLIT